MNNKFLKMAVVGLILSVSGFANAGVITSEGHPSLAGATKVDLNPILGTDYDEYFFSGGSFSDWSGTALPGFYAGFQSYGQSAGGEPAPSLLNGGDNINPVSFILNFDSAVSAFGMHTAAVNRAWNIQLLDESQSVLEAHTFGAGSLYMGATASGIKSVVFSEAGGDIIYFDGLSFVSEEVPEPSTLAIFALGLMGLAARRFKKQA